MVESAPMRLVVPDSEDEDAAVTMAQGRSRPAWAEIDLSAVAHNAAVLARLVAPAELCAVVKAHGYGHGGPAVARAALAGGAQRLAVALVDEGVELRQHGVDAPVLLLSECGLNAVD
ncbi:MAG: alanine racemase, partial [Acidimicrobiales bacterium]